MVFLQSKARGICYRASFGKLDPGRVLRRRPSKFQPPAPPSFVSDLRCGCEFTRGPNGISLVGLGRPSPVRDHLKNGTMVPKCIVVSPSRFTCEELDTITALASPLPPSVRDAFLKLIANRLSGEVQRDFLKAGPIAVSRKYSRSQPLRQGQRRL